MSIFPLSIPAKPVKVPPTASSPNPISPANSPQTNWFTSVRCSLKTKRRSTKTRTTPIYQTTSMNTKTMTMKTRKKMKKLRRKKTKMKRKKPHMKISWPTVIRVPVAICIIPDHLPIYIQLI